MASLYFGATLEAYNITVSSKDSSGNFTVSGTLHNPDSVTTSTGNPRLTVSIDGGSTWRRISTSSLAAGATYSGSLSYSSSASSTTAVQIYLRNDYSDGPGTTLYAAAYEDPTPSMTAPSLSISPTDSYMGEALTIAENGGEGYRASSRSVLVNGSSVASFSLGTYKPAITTFEPLCPNANSLTATFRGSYTASSGYQGSGSRSVNVTLRVPLTYQPTATHTYEYLNAQNNSLVAGYSQLKITIDPDLTPADNSATITSVVLASVTSTNSAITTSTFTQTSGSYVWTSSVLPTLSGSPSYTMDLTFLITDSRGRTLQYTPKDDNGSSWRVTNFIPPYVSIDDLRRSTATTAVLSATITSPSAAYECKLKLGADGTEVDVLNDLVATSTGYTLEHTFTGLTSGNQYMVYLYYQDTNMHTYGEARYTYQQLLSTLQMPLSLYDDGTKSYVSYGEEAQDDYSGASSDVVINFAKGSELRATNDTTTVYVDAYDLVNAIPEIDAIKTTTLAGKHIVIISQDDYEALTTKDQTAIYLTYEE